MEAPLTDGANDAGEDLLRIGATPGAIAATNLPSHDGGTNGLLRAPVRCVDSRFPQKGEDGRELGGQMRSEAWAAGSAGAESISRTRRARRRPRTMGLSRTCSHNAV